MKELYDNVETTMNSIAPTFALCDKFIFINFLIITILLFVLFSYIIQNQSYLHCVTLAN